MGIGDAASTAGWSPRGNVIIRRSTLEGSVPDLKRFRTPQLLHSKSSGIWFWFSKSSGICLWFRRNSDLQEESSAMEDQTLETVFEKCDVISVHDQGQENNNIGKNDIVSNQVCEISSDQERNLPILQKIDALSTKIQIRRVLDAFHSNKEGTTIRKLRGCFTFDHLYSQAGG
ncbi:hypothetical protein NE237_024043 [Protea cynaroides]|uniref:Uncharacterized protein n=1 Tax=Protea cynaroides TaxID=273540 RepID=A0A9Q0HI18_9MAGN|nr:hypothetical protein NE237_024043 [Protea cynaroides]